MFCPQIPSTFCWPTKALRLKTNLAKVQSQPDGRPYCHTSATDFCRFVAIQLPSKILHGIRAEHGTRVPGWYPDTRVDLPGHTWIRIAPTVPLLVAYPGRGTRVAGSSGRRGKNATPFFFESHGSCLTCFRLCAYECKPIPTKVGFLPRYTG